MNSSKFKGPLFIVGVSRSGTKLLRDILNNNDNVSITDSETHFVPYLLDKYTNTKPSEELSKSVHSDLINSSFYLRKSKVNKTISEDNFLKNTTNSTLNEIIEFILKFFGSKGIKDELIEGTVIWGDKTPSYVNNMIQLKKAFPEAKFIHMIRDPRDVALSFKNSWGKNLLSSANKWNNCILKAKNDALILGKDYCEIRYENLTNNSEFVIKSVCKYIDIEYSKEMSNLRKPSEYFGDAKNTKQIVQNNSNKYFSSISQEKIKRIEEICFLSLKYTGYKINYAQKTNPISKTNILFLRLYDFYKYILHILFKEWNIINGPIFIYRILKLKVKSK